MTCDYQIRARARIKTMNRAQLFTKATEKVEVEEKAACYAEGASRAKESGDDLDRVITLPTGAVVTHNEAHAMILSGLLSKDWYMKHLDAAYNRSFAQQTIKTKQKIVSEIVLAQGVGFKRKVG